MLSRKMSNHRTKAPPNRSSAPPGFVQNWLTLPGGQTVPLLATLGTGRHWAGRLGSVAPADGRGLGLWAKLQGNRPPSRLPIPGLPPPLPDSSFPSGMRLGPQEVMPASFCKSTGPWLYGDSEARTEYVQNDFFTSKVERHPFDKGPFGEGYRGKLRVSFVPKAAAGSWHRAWNTTGREGLAFSCTPSLGLPPPPHHSASVDTNWGSCFPCPPPKKLTLHTTQLCVLSQRNEWRRCSG